MKRITLILLTSLLGPAVYAAEPPVIDPHRLSDEVRTLSSDNFQGRGPATPSEGKTIDYVIGQLKAAGIEPGGDLIHGQRSWTQAVPLLRSEIKGTPSLELQTGDNVSNLSQGQEIAVRAPLDGSKSVDISHAPLVFLGYGVDAPERHWNDFQGIDLHGKIALVLINDPDFEAGQGDFGGKAMTYYGRWTYKYEEAARRGALGVLIVHETAPASYGWATVANSNTNATFDIVRDHPDRVHPRLEGWVQRGLAVQIFRAAGLDFEALKRQAQTRNFKPVVLNGASLSARFDAESQVITSHNIVGRIKGSEHPDQTVIYSAHWDHLGVAAPDAKGDRIYNGAVDNATGTAALIELARAFAHAPRPKRSLIFLNVTAEEKGLLGSEYYAAKPLYPLAKTVAVLNMDALDPHGPARNFTISGNVKLDLLDQLKQTAKQWNLSYSPDPKPEAGYFFRSDHFSFAKRGVPALSFSSGDDWIDGGLAAGKAAENEYTAKHYHQPSDEWQADWKFTGMARDLQILYSLGEQLANSQAWPNWSQDSEFRGIRDTSTAARK